MARRRALSTVTLRRFRHLISRPVALGARPQILDLADEEDEEQEGEEEERGGLVAEAVRDVAALLEAVDAQLAQGSNFEFTAALLQLVLQVHGEAISRRRVLRDAAARVSRRLTPLWARLDGLLGDVRCMTAFFANLQG